MAGLGVLIKSNLGRLGQFSGRMPRREFWPYVGCVIAAWFIIGWVLFIPIVLALMFSHGEFWPILAFMGEAMTLALVALVVIASAVARRLHDTNLSAIFGLLPVPFLIFGMTGIVAPFAGLLSGRINFSWLTVIFINNMIYLMMLTILIILLVRPGTHHANRFGDAAPG